MSNIFIDIGSYSIKLLEARLDSKHIHVKNFREMIINEIKDQLPQEMSHDMAQRQILQTYFKDLPVDQKVMYQLPSNFITTRYLTLPINNIKKAEQMLPFQLEENLPFPLLDTHFIASYKKNNDNISIIAHVLKKSNMSTFYNAAKSTNTLASHLVSELSIIDSYVQNNPNKNNYAIVDLGHTTTKIYICSNGQIISNHIIYTAGKNITEAIAHNYQISNKEAEIYKHENSFFLTDAQVKSVDKNQLEFSKLMKDTFWPVILELRKWKLNFKLQFNENIEQIFITGGSSNISNISNFIAEQVACSVEKINLTNHFKGSIASDSKESASRGIIELMAISSISKPIPPNFLCKDFPSLFHNTIPLASTLFITARVATVAAVILFALLIEGMFLTSQKKQIDKSITSLTKNVELELTSKEKRLVQKEPYTFYKLMQKKIREQRKFQTQIEELVKENALLPLAKISNKLADISSSLQLESFESDTKKTRGKIFIKDQTFNKAELMNKIKTSVDSKVLFDSNETGYLSFEYGIKK